MSDVWLMKQYGNQIEGRLFLFRTWSGIRYGAAYLGKIDIFISRQGNSCVQCPFKSVV